MFQVQEKNILNEELLNDDDLTSLFVRQTSLTYLFIFSVLKSEKTKGGATRPRLGYDLHKGMEGLSSAPQL